MTPCDWKRCLEVKQQAEDWYDLLDGILVSRADMTEDNGHTCLVSQLRALVSRVRIESRRVQTLAMSSIKLLLAREAARAAAEPWVIRANGECGLPSFSASEGSGQAEEAGERKCRRRDGVIVWGYGR